MIRSYNGVRLLSSHLISDACRSIYEGVFDRKLDSGILTLSRVIGVRVVGHGTVNPNTRLLSNTSIRGSVSLSRPDYEISNYLGREPLPPAKGVTEKKFRKGFKDWCHGVIFSSEGEKDYMFKWFCDNYPYGRQFYYGYGGNPTDSRFIGPLDEEVFGSNELPRDELEEDYMKKRYQGCYICSNHIITKFIGPPDEEVFGSNELPRDELEEDYLKKHYQGCYVCSNRLPDIERGT